MTDGRTPKGGRGGGRELTESERELWRRAMRDAVPLRRGRRAGGTADTSALSTLPVGLGPDVAAPAALTPPTADPERRAAVPPRPAQPPRILKAGEAVDLDRSSAERLRRGRMPIEARLDLHGLTREFAHRRLERFLDDSQRAERRCVLVITGKGAGKDGEDGVLRRAVPRWLNESPNRPRILAFSTAQPRDGGSGALYVLLRKRRTAS